MMKQKMANESIDKHFPQLKDIKKSNDWENRIKKLEENEQEKS